MTDKQVTDADLRLHIVDGVHLATASELGNILTETLLIEAEAEVAEVLALSDASLVDRVLVDPKAPVHAIELAIRMEGYMTDLAVLADDIHRLQARIHELENSRGDDA